jgi:hypothetical protein
MGCEDAQQLPGLLLFSTLKCTSIRSAQQGQHLVGCLHIKGYKGKLFKTSNDKILYLITLGRHLKIPSRDGHEKLSNTQLYVPKISPLTLAYAE